MKVGDIYEDCSYHPMVCIEVDDDGDGLLGVSMVNGRVGGCSESYCGVWQLTPQQAHGLMQFWACLTFHQALDPNAFSEYESSWGPMPDFVELLRNFMEGRPEWEDAEE